MSIEKFKEAVYNKNVQGAVSAIKGLKDPNKTYEILDGDTPILYAAQFDFSEILGPLLDLGLNPNVWNGMGWSPLHYAVCHQDLDAYTTLVEAGASITQLGHPKAPLLPIAISKGDMEFCQRLLEAGVDVNEVDYYGNTPIVYAAGVDNPEMWEMLISAGADIDAVSSKVLHAAARDGNIRTCEYLIEYGIDVNGKSDEGFTPLHHAAVKDLPEVCKFLREVGADLTAQTDKGYTPIDLAKQRMYKSVIEVLK